MAEFRRASRYAGGIEAYANKLVGRWNDGNRAERRRITKALRKARGPRLPELLQVLPTEIISKI